MIFVSKDCTNFSYVIFVGVRVVDRFFSPLRGFLTSSVSNVSPSSPGGNSTRDLESRSFQVRTDRTDTKVNDRLRSQGVSNFNHPFIGLVRDVCSKKRHLGHSIKEDLRRFSRYCC